MCIYNLKMVYVGMNSIGKVYVQFRSRKNISIGKKQVNVQVQDIQNLLGHPVYTEVIYSFGILEGTVKEEEEPSLFLSSTEIMSLPLSFQ